MRRAGGVACRWGRRPIEFTVGQYNILAGYLGNNMEPWFLYGVNMPDERRRAIFRMHREKLPNGDHANFGWPKYVKGILSDEEIRRVEQIHQQHFAWEQRRWRLLEVIQGMKCDLLSLVECDHYQDHFKPALLKMGYESIWRKRPRATSADGCCVAWRSDLFRLLEEENVEFIDRTCPVQGNEFKDRIALIALLQQKGSRQKICLVSTHLQRNPEDLAQEMLRAKQVGQVLRALVDFATKHDVFEVPVVLAGDLNCSSFGRLRGVANTLSLLNRDVVLHPFTFDTADVPTGVTSVTLARKLRIDAIVYQCQRLELVDVQESPDLHEAIPNERHPSDHVPIVARFRCRSQRGRNGLRHVAKEWFWSLAGREASTVLSTAQLQRAFQVYEDGNGRISASSFQKALTLLFPRAFAADANVSTAVERFREAGDVNCEEFVAMYLEAVKMGGLPGLNDLRDAFRLLDRDQNGTLDLQELLDAFEQCAPTRVPRDEIEALFRSIDLNGDGTIDAEEMIEFLAKTWMESPRWQLRTPLLAESHGRIRRTWRATSKA